jgi:hypothetical protein
VVTAFFTLAGVMFLLFWPLEFYLRRLKGTIIRKFPTDFISSRRRPSSAIKLIAVRAPNDEASIAIATSQFIQLVADAICTALLVKPFLWLFRFATWKSLLIGSTAIALAVTFAGIVLNYMQSGGANAEDAILTMVLWSGTALLVLTTLLSYVVAFVALVGALLLMPAQAILALATGREALSFFGLVSVECEPIPSGFTGMVATIRANDDERRSVSLMHYIHEIREAREVVAKFVANL